MPFTLTPNWMRKLRRRKSSDDINAIAADGSFIPGRRGSSPNRRGGLFSSFARRHRSPARGRRGSPPRPHPTFQPPRIHDANFQPSVIRTVFIPNPPTPEASRVGLFPPPRPEPQAVPISASIGRIRNEHSFTRQEINQLSKFPEPRGVNDPPPVATKDHVNWKKFNRLQEQTLSETLQPSSEAIFPNAYPDLYESRDHLSVLESMGIDITAPEREISRLQAMSQDHLDLSSREFVQYLIGELEKIQKSMCEEYEDIDDYEMQHPTPAQLYTPSQYLTSSVSNLVTHDEEKPKVAKLTKKPLKLTKSLHNLKHDKLANVREVSAHFNRHMDEDQATTPRRKLSSGEYFTDATYFHHLGEKVSPLLYSDPDLVNSQKVTVKTSGTDLVNSQKPEVTTNSADLVNLREAEVKTSGTDLVNLRETEVKTSGADLVNLRKAEVKTRGADLVNRQKPEANTNGEYYDGVMERLKHEGFVQPAKKTDKSADNSAVSHKHDEKNQKLKTKTSGVPLLTKQKYVSSEDFRQMNDSVFPIPKSESTLARIKADARIYERTKQAARILPTIKQTDLQRTYANALDNAPVAPPPIPERNVARVQGTTGSTKNLLSTQPTRTTNTFGWTQSERDALHSGTYQPAAPVTQFPMRHGMDPEAPVGRNAHLPTIRKMKSEGYALTPRQRAAHIPPAQTTHLGQVTEQGAPSARPRRRVMFEGDSSAETSSRGGAVPRGTTISDGSSSRADNSSSGSVSITHHLPSAMRFPPRVYGGSRRVLMTDNGRVEFAQPSPANIHPPPLPSVRSGELGQESVSRRHGYHRQAGGKDGRARVEAAETARDQASRIGGGRGNKCEADEVGLFDNRCDPAHHSTVVMPSTSLDEERGSVDLNNTARRLSMLRRHRQELGLPQRPRPALTFEIEEPRPTTPPNWMANLASSFGRTGDVPSRQRARYSFPFSRRPASLAARPRLLLPAATHYANLARLERDVSVRVFFCCGVLPPMWLAYGYGGLDWYMRWASSGQVNEMSAALKERAVPLGWVYGLLAVALATLLSVYLSTVSA
ncbi:hypothetical protein MMC27_003831 [Xylographa pallens]|nr:hypothetical protein [Xylographa pallens]